jgi:hypothetical protein
LVVRSEGQTLLQVSEPIAAGQPVVISDLTTLRAGRRELQIEASPQDPTAAAPRAIRVSVFRAGGGCARGVGGAPGGAGGGEADDDLAAVGRVLHLLDEAELRAAFCAPTTTRGVADYQDAPAFVEDAGGPPGTIRGQQQDLSKIVRDGRMFFCRPCPRARRR